MELTEPRPKKYSRLKPSLPLPVLKDSNNDTHVLKGKFTGYSILIEDENKMKTFLSMGYFGKANFSRSFPTFLQHKFQSEILRKRQYDRRKEWSRKFGDKKFNRKCIIVPDSDDEIEDYFKNVKAHSEIDCSGLTENVHLLFEEAFFLQNFVKCLDIRNGNLVLCPEESWQTFKANEKNFVPNYVVYHYYRSRNWVVKPGIKFGGDFLLYKQGPPFYHASYLVIINIAHENWDKISKCTSKNTIQIQAFNRLSENVGKELIICQVIWPTGLTNVQIEDICKFDIKEIVIQRWLPSLERQTEDYE